MPSYKKTDLNKVVRNNKRASYDEELIYSILDAGFLCHVGYVWEEQAIVIPTAYGRKDNKIYLHGAMKNRMMTQLAQAGKGSITVTHIDGLVMARSIFHHSMNYRSAVVFGSITEVKKKKEKLEALKIVSEQIFPGRWDEVREPNDKEMKATMVICLEIETASAKVRTGPPIDEPEDYALPVWAGELPIKSDMLPPLSDDALPESIEPSETIHIGRGFYLAKQLLPGYGEEED